MLGRRQSLVVGAGECVVRGYAGQVEATAVPWFLVIYPAVIHFVVASPVRSRRRHGLTQRNRVTGDAQSRRVRRGRDATRAVRIGSCARTSVPPERVRAHDPIQAAPVGPLGGPTRRTSPLLLCCCSNSLCENRFSVTSVTRTVRLREPDRTPPGSPSVRSGHARRCATPVEPRITPHAARFGLPRSSPFVSLLRFSV